MTAGTLAIALTAPFTGALADIVGRKRLITAVMFATRIPTLLTIFCRQRPGQMIALRFLQGLLLPPIFTVAVAYIGDEWPAADGGRVAGIYISGTSIGSDFAVAASISGALADLIGWRAAYGVMAALTLIAAIVVAITLTPEKRFVPSGGLANSLRYMLKHLRDPSAAGDLRDRLRRAVRVSSPHFTYVSFHLAAPPYLFTPTLFHLLFLTYRASSLFGAVGRARHGTCSGGGRPSSASSRSGSSASSCCWPRRSPSSPPASHCARCAACCARRFRPAMSR